MIVKDKLAEVAEEVLGDLQYYAHKCHEASAKLVKSGQFGTCRVARGMCPGVGGQHSWVVLGDDCYDVNATIVDPTLWSYDDSIEGIWIGTGLDIGHTPHASGSILEYGRPAPPEPGADIIELTPPGPWSDYAARFLDVLGPLDRRGWAALAHAPVGEWPAKEIITAMAQDDRISALIPIDTVGMITDLNPSGLYLPGEEKE